MQYVLSLSLSLPQSLFIAATPPQSVANAPDAKAALSLSLCFLRLALFVADFWCREPAIIAR